MAVALFDYSWDRLGDSTELEAGLAPFPADRIRRLAVLGKTEGTATLNDFSREVAILAAERAIRRHGGEALLARTTMIFSTGCEGVITPFSYVLAELADDPPVPASGPARLAIGGAATAAIPPEHRGALPHLDAVAEATRRAMAEAGLTAEQVAIVFVKSPVLPRRALAALPRAYAARAGSTGLARSVAALGVAAALGEVDRTAMTDASIGGDLSLYSRRCFAFSGTELDHNEVIVLGNRPGAGGVLVAACAGTRDLIDARAVRGLARSLGCGFDVDGEIVAPHPLRAMFLKVGVAPGGLLRGERTTVFESELDPDKHMRSAASGLIGAVFGTTRVFVTGGSEQQAPPGGGLFAAIAEARQ
ncbi:MAG: ring-opening amidohydrolase [Alphaproteobacteria bacterium]|nr:ring-opening amidohydrolase [Alphaproteobacteria bacterium]